MTLLAVERIKLFSTRSPWWCALVTLALTVGMSALVVSQSDARFPATVASTQFGYGLGLTVIMVLAALSITTEYRFGTIRTTFQAVPHRGSALIAKTGVVAAMAFVIGEICAFASWGLGVVIHSTGNLALSSTADWINVAGVGVLYALAAVIAVAVGALIRHSAGAISLLLIYSMVVEGLVQLIPGGIGANIHKWLPFNVANKFLTGSGGANGSRDAAAGAPLSDSPLPPGWALAYFAGFAILLMAIAITTVKRRDA